MWNRFLPGSRLVLLFCLGLCWQIAPAQLRLIYNETFVSNKESWPLSDDAAFSMKVAQGHYQLKITDGSGRWVTIIPQINPKTYFIIEVKFKAVPTDKEFGVGIIWNLGDEEKNIAVWRNTGDVEVYKTVGGTETSLGAETSTYKFNDDQYHTLKVKSFSNRSEYYVDDHLVKKGEKLAFKFGSRVGFYVSANGAVDFDHLKVYQEREEINLITTDFNVTNKENLGSAVNTIYSEVQPIISHDGKTLYFSRKDCPQNVDGVKDDIWYSEKDANNKFSTAKNLGKPVNNSTYNTCAGFSADGKKMVAFGKYNPDGTSLSDGFCEFTKTASGWSNPVNLDVKNYYNTNTYGEATYSPDGSVMIFTIERKDTYGGKDLYVSLKQADGSWSAPFNAGHVVNSFADEISPFLAGDNKTLYFASEGHSGYGAADVFMTRRLDDTWTNWSKPVNMGPKINSNEWDAYFSIDAKGEWAYMASNHLSLGKTDIFRFQIPAELKPDTVAAEKVLQTLKAETPVLVKIDSTVFKDSIRIITHTETVLKNTDTIREQNLEHVKYQARIFGKVYDARTKEPLAAPVSIKEMENNTEVIALSGDVNGYEANLGEGLHYSVYANYTGYMAETKNIDLTTAHGNYSQQVDLYLKKVEVDQTVVMNNIFFEESSTELRYDSRGELTNVVTLMQQYPTMTILIGGHTSKNHSDPKLHHKLSEARAKAVFTELVKMGINKKRLKFKGYGYDKPEYDVNSLWENAKNRRVDFTIVSM